MALQASLFSASAGHRNYRRPPKCSRQIGAHAVVYSSYELSDPGKVDEQPAYAPV